MNIEKGPKVVVIGGGTGLPVVLKGLKEKCCDITAVVTVADDGGSSGELRKIMNIAPPGDLRNVLVSLSHIDEEAKDLFQYRFSKDTPLAPHALGNLIIAALTDMKGSIYEAVQSLSKEMKVEGHVYPASEQSVTLHAVFQDGTTVSGESAIAKTRKIIEHVYVTESDHLNQKPKASPHVVEAIKDAEMIVFGPGSLFTSILPNLMIPEIGKAVLASKAEKVYICNIMTQKGETENFSDADHVRVLHEHLHHSFIDTVLVNVEEVPENAMNTERYDEYLVQVSHDAEGLVSAGVSIIADNFLCLRDEGVFHDEKKVVDTLIGQLSKY